MQKQSWQSSQVLRRFTVEPASDLFQLNVELHIFILMFVKLLLRICSLAHLLSFTACVVHDCSHDDLIMHITTV